MVNEVESRMEIDVNRVEEVRAIVNSRLELSGNILTLGKRRIHTDTYFDTQHQSLYRKGWSLRIRESTRDFSLTLKGPSVQSVGAIIERREVESPRDGTMDQVIAQILREMADEGLINAPSQNVQRELLQSGVATALSSVGLRKIFDVETDRQTWLAARSGGQPFAEVALDRSRYKIGQDEPAEEARIEIELLDNSHEQDLLQMSAAALRAFGARQVNESKFERGVVYARSRGLQEKMEAKVRLISDEKYEEIVRSIDSDSNLLRGYRFGRADDNISLTDRYYDTPTFALFERGWYLRLRKQGEAIKLTFRRLTEEARQGQVLQSEIVVDWARDNTRESWRAMWPWLQQVAPRASDAPDLRSPKFLDEVLAGAGFILTLNVTVVRTSWIVDKVAINNAITLRPIGERVAKLKYDRIRYSSPTRLRAEFKDREFEVTGVEQHDASPTSLLHDAYQTFLALFVEQCAHASRGEVEQRINAKYFAGVVVLGLVDAPPAWLTDGRLALRVSAFRESDFGAPPVLGIAETLVALRDQTRDRAAREGQLEISAEYAKRYNALAEMLRREAALDIPPLAVSGQIRVRDLVDAVDFTLDMIRETDRIRTGSEGVTITDGGGDDKEFDSSKQTTKRIPRAFIGCSTEGLPYARIIQLELDRRVRTSIWSQGVFELSQGILETLIRTTDDYDYAILVLTPDDVVLKRAELGRSARDNVIFELGLFIGALGRERVLVAAQVGVTLPTDLAGISVANFEPTDSHNPVPNLGPVVTKLMLKMGVF